jgi:hypothetical protein
MATPQLSPGVLVREVDLTVGRADNVFDNVGGIAGPFSQGPVNEVVDINSEKDLLNVFGKPISTDRQYEYWLSVSSFLSYGGRAKVVRVDGSALKNAIVGIAETTQAVKIRNYEEYSEAYSGDGVQFLYAAKNPGTWANGLKVCSIDAFADQTISLAAADPVGAGVTIGTEVRKDLTNVTVPGVGTTTVFNGFLRGIVVGVSTAAVGNGTIDVKILSTVDSNGVEVAVDYAGRNPVSSLAQLDQVTFRNTNGEISIGIGTTSVTGGVIVQNALDWYDQQTLGLTNQVLYWKNIAPKPRSTNFALQRNGRNDEIHVVVVDDLGAYTGTQGTILEKWVGLSKAKDATSEVNAPSKNWYKQQIANFSTLIYAGSNKSAVNGEAIAARFTTVTSGISTTPATLADGVWNQNAQGINFNSIGAKSFTLGGVGAAATTWTGVDYAAVGTMGVMAATLGNLNTAYDLFNNEDDIQLDFLIGGPGLASEVDSQALATNLLTIANSRKDCIATISPWRDALLGDEGPKQSSVQTSNVNKFFNGITLSTSYGVFDSSWKYTYDRFNNQFVYIPCNADVAGMMVRTTLENYPWYSPAGQQRGVLNNAIKLAYNPSKAQRDSIYPNRINPIISSPGVGLVLFGDKTALTYQSAFDRINVRRLFITLKKALTRSAEAQLFEFNDAITRSNFVNIVEPYLRDVQAKRGVYEFLVICDESNNTPDIIDNNEFRADIYLKPAKSINYVTLTFVATRTGVSFDEVVGSV